MRPVTAWPQGPSELAVIPAGTAFTADDIVFYADQENRTLDEALQEATLIVSCPHSGSAVP